MIVEHRIYTFRRQGRGAIVTFAAAAHMDTEEVMPAELTEFAR